MKFATKKSCILVMIFGLVLLFVESFSSMLDDPPLSCSFTESISINHVFSFTNPNWPGTYRPGEVCRWDFKCHDGFVCRLLCHDVGLPQSKGCYMDMLMVSPTGDKLFRDALKYCGGRRINVRSSSTSMSMVLKASFVSPGGRFRCLVKTEQLDWE